MRAIAYVRCSTAEQQHSGLGLAAQRRRIQEESDRQGLDVIDVIEEAMSGKEYERRLGLLRAIDRIEAGEADALVVARQDRLSRGGLDVYLDIVKRAKRRGWKLVCLDSRGDDETPDGKFSNRLDALLAERERDLISWRTRVALGELKSAGYHVGRPPAGMRIVEGRLAPDPENTQALAAVHRAAALRASGLSLQAVADTLNAEGWGTQRGGRRIYHCTVAKWLRNAVLVEAAMCGA